MGEVICEIHSGHFVETIYDEFFILIEHEKKFPKEETQINALRCVPFYNIETW